MNEEFLRKILWTFPEQDVIKTILNFYEDLQQKVEQLRKENGQYKKLLGIKESEQIDNQKKK